MSKIKLECCANSVESAINGQAGGAHRIELCANLELGGTTPSAAAICMASEVLEVDLFVLIRPRAGNFCYSELEMEQIIQDIDFCKQVGCDGVVVGALDKNFNIDIEKTKRMVKAAGLMSVTFNRAFDEVKDSKKALMDVISTGCSSVLTSGRQTSVKEGIENIKQLYDLSDSEISIIAGGALDVVSALQLYAHGLKEFHMSATDKKQDPPRRTQIELVENFLVNFEEL